MRSAANAALYANWGGIFVTDAPTLVGAVVFSNAKPTSVTVSWPTGGSVLPLTYKYQINNGPWLTTAATSVLLKSLDTESLVQLRVAAVDSANNESSFLLGAIKLPAAHQNPFETVFFPTTVKQQIYQAIITAAGANAVWRHYTGPRPSNLGSITGANTLVATHTHSGVLGTATVDGLVFGALIPDASNLTGVPAFARLTTSGGTVVLDAAYQSDGGIFMTGASIFGSPFIFSPSALAL